jgi:isocitrate/isopropylmalate dehydrogenase
MLRSVALLLRHTADEAELATALGLAVDHALEHTPTVDAGGSATTAAFTESVLEQLETAASRR